jgi:hypothetical protein
MNSLRPKTYNGIVLKMFIDGKLTTKTFRNVPSDTIKAANKIISSEYKGKRKGTFWVGYDWMNKPIWLRGVLYGVLYV